MLRIEDVFPAGGAATYLAHLGDLVGGIHGGGVWSEVSDLLAERGLALIDVLDRGIFGHGSDDLGDLAPEPDNEVLGRGPAVLMVSGRIPGGDHGIAVASVVMQRGDFKRMDDELRGV